jgi:hypothetical protein
MILVTYLYQWRIIYMLRKVPYICIHLVSTAASGDGNNDVFRDLRLEVDDSISNNKKNGFKSNNRIYRKVFNKTSRESKSVDQFGDDYFYSSKEDETIPISITLPKSLLIEVNNYCKKRGLTRSRLIRKVLVYSLNLKKD